MASSSSCSAQPRRSGPRGRRTRAASRAALRLLRVVQSGAGEPVQALQQRPGVRDVAADGRVGPRAVAVPVEPQVQLDEPRDVLDRVLVEPQRLQPLRGRAWRRPPRGGGSSRRRRPRTGGSPACRCRAAARRAAAPGPGRAPAPSGRSPARSPGRAPSASARRRPCAGGARRSRAAAPAARAARASASPVSTSSSSPARGSSARAAACRARLHPLGRDDRDPLGHRRHRGHVLGADLEAELGGEPRGAHHPQRVVVERPLRRDRGPQHAAQQVGQPAERVDEGQLRQRARPSR